MQKNTLFPCFVFDYMKPIDIYKALQIKLVTFCIVLWVGYPMDDIMIAPVNEYIIYMLLTSVCVKYNHANSTSCTFPLVVLPCKYI